jgi:hypothetical protein
MSIEYFNISCQRYAEEWTKRRQQHQQQRPPTTTSLDRVLALEGELLEQEPVRLLLEYAA